MARYTSLQEQDIEKIASAYGLTIGKVEPMPGGAGNSSSLIETTRQRLVVTVFEEKSMEEITTLGRLLLHLEKAKFPTTRLFLPQSTDNLFESPLDKPILVKEYIRGEPATSLNRAELEQIGAALAHLHSIPPPAVLPDRHSYGRQCFPSVFDAGIDPTYEAWLSETTERLDNQIPDDLPRALIHGDLFWDNVLWDGGRLIAVIDFEEASRYYRIFDLGMCILGTCMAEGVLDLAKSSALLNGYRERGAILDIELENLPLFIEYAAAATSYWRFWKYNIYQPTPSKSSLHWEMVSCINAVRSISNETFLDAHSG